MQIEARIFELLTVFFILVGSSMAFHRTVAHRRRMGGHHRYRADRRLTLIIGTYFRFVARRLDLRPEDYEEAEIADGAGDLGFFSPGSIWPITLAAAAAVTATGFAFFQIWLIAIRGCLRADRRVRSGLRIPPRSGEALTACGPVK